jgi:hypothetical protein
VGKIRFLLDLFDLAGARIDAVARTAKVGGYERYRNARVSRD